MATPLPPQIITTILDHLLPPRPPLPPQLLSKALTDRLIFLPPGRGDADSYLTPTPSTSTLSNPIATALEDLSHGYTVGQTFYAHDGESTLAKITIDPEFNSNSNASDTDHSGRDPSPMTIMFIHESQWKYHTTTTSPPSHLSWSSDPEVITPPEMSNEPNEQSVEDYWRGFSPKGDSMDLQDDPEGDGEDAYWAAYGGGTGTGGEPSRNPSFANFDHLTAKSFSTISSAQPDKTENDSGRRVMCDMPTNNGALDPLAALLATIPDSIPASTSAKPSRGSIDLRDKVQGRIKGSLTDLWGMFTGGENLSGAMAEEKALGWIRLARGVVDRSPPVGGTTQEEVIIRAKMEVLRDMWEVTLDSEDDDDDGSFWRCVEGVIRMGVEPDPEGEGMTQETYWE